MLPISGAEDEQAGGVIWQCIPPGDPIPWNVDPNPVNNAVSLDTEIREWVQGLSDGRRGGTSFIRGEDLKRWIRGAEEEEDAELEEGI